MTSTIERPRPVPSRATGVPNLRLYLVASLATVYVMTWWMLGARAPARSVEATAIEPASKVNSPPRRVAWLDELPPDERPVVDLPAGWHIAEPTAQSSSVTRPAAVRPVRVSPSRPGRLRTRSS